jgi:mutator protein MutT
MGVNLDRKILNIAVGAIIHNSNILLIKRKKDPFKDIWGMPGGKMDFGENPEITVIREIKEETGLNCENLGLRCVVSEIIYNNNEKTAHNLLYIYLLKPKSFELHKSDEGDLSWFDMNLLEKESIIPSDMLMIKEFIIKESKAKLFNIQMIEDNGKYRVEEFRE